MRYLSVCAGIEAATVAWHDLSWEPAGFAEIERFPSEVLAHHYPDVPKLGDMTKYKEWDIGSIDLLVGGTPCQSFSVAGLRKGLEDPRGNLALVYCGILDHYRPQWFVWENVPGVLSSNGGRDFGSFLRAVAELGYGFSYRVLDAQYWGVAQRRRRVFVVGHLGDWRPAAAVLFESKSLSRDTQPSRETGQKTTSSTPLGLGADGELARALNACKTASGRMDATVDTYVACRKSKRARSDNDDEIWVEDGAANTLNVFDSGDTRTTHAVVQPITFPSVLSNQSVSTENLSCTLEAKNPTAVVQPVAPTLTASNDPSRSPQSTEVTNQVAAVHAASMAVHRLTPVECERLQGFPDNYTNIKENCPDGPRYKALGNSMAVPVMRWIGGRIHGQNAI